MAEKTVLSTIHAAMQALKQGEKRVDIVNEAPADAKFPVRVVAQRIGVLARIDVMGFLDQ